MAVRGGGLTRLPPHNAAKTEKVDEMVKKLAIAGVAMLALAACTQHEQRIGHGGQYAAVRIH